MTRLLSRKTFARTMLGAALAVVLLPGLAAATTVAPFTAAAFQAAQAAGDPVLVEIHADWCPTCKA